MFDSENMVVYIIECLVIYKFIQSYAFAKVSVYIWTSI